VLSGESTRRHVTFIKQKKAARISEQTPPPALFLLQLCLGCRKFLDHFLHLWLYFLNLSFMNLYLLVLAFQSHMMLLQQLRVLLQSFYRPADPMHHVLICFRIKDALCHFLGRFFLDRHGKTLGQLLHDLRFGVSFIPQPPDLLQHLDRFRPVVRDRSDFSRRYEHVKLYDPVRHGAFGYAYGLDQLTLAKQLFQPAPPLPVRSSSIRPSSMISVVRSSSVRPLVRCNPSVFRPSNLSYQQYFSKRDFPQNISIFDFPKKSLCVIVEYKENASGKRMPLKDLWTKK